MQTESPMKMADGSVFSKIRTTNGLTQETLSNQIKMAFARNIISSGRDVLYMGVYNDVIDKITKWLLNGDNYRNLLLYGGVGIGKTTCLRSVAEVLSNTRAFGYIAFISANSISSEKFFNGDGWRVVNTYPLVMIDDIGTELSDFKVYGTDIHPMKIIIEERYLHKLPIIATTNLTFEDFGDKYGMRVMDRMKEFDIIKVNINKSLR